MSSRTESHTVTPSVLKLIKDHSDNCGEAKRWISYYEENGFLPDDFRNRFYAKHNEVTLAGNSAVEDACEPQPLLF